MSVIGNEMSEKILAGVLDVSVLAEVDSLQFPEDDLFCWHFVDSAINKDPFLGTLVS